MGDPGSIPVRQVDRLNRVLAAAWQTEPYRELYGHDRPVLQRIEEIRDLPPLARETLAGVPLDRRVLPGSRPFVESQTSGTTGQPLAFAWSREEAIINRALWFRQRDLQERPPDARWLSLAVGFQRREPLTRAGRHALIGAYLPVERLTAAIHQVRPSVLAGSPSSLLEVSEHVEPPPAGIETYAEVLAPELRVRLKELFDADPIDVYATGEVGPVAWQCRERAGYHVNADAIIVEILDPVGKPLPVGEIGEVALTALWITTTPLIRIRVGDMGRMLPGACPCGCPLPLMSQVEGRTLDWILAPDGRRLSPLRFMLGALGSDFGRAVDGFRIVQRAVDDFLLEVIWRNGPVSGLEQEVASRYSAVLGCRVRVQVTALRELSRSPSGKVQLVKSRVSGIRA
ncbi:MAG: phenylacetate--CoA ligase family protein [Actinomycetota bacterium]